MKKTGPGDGAEGSKAGAGPSGPLACSALVMGWLPVCCCCFCTSWQRSIMPLPRRIPPGPAVEVELPHHPHLLLWPPGAASGRASQGCAVTATPATLPTLPGGDSGHSLRQPAEFSSGWPDAGCSEAVVTLKQKATCFLLGGVTPVKGCSPEPSRPARPRYGILSFA